MSNYDIPSWAGKPPTGLHLDVTKDGKLIQKLMIDEKRCYLFGRNAQLNDFCIDHGSCSRVHSALVYHKHLNRAFLVDLSSTHGTYIGNMRLEGQKPTQLPIDSKFHFGASTRMYIIRERPQAGPRSHAVMDELEATAKEGQKAKEGQAKAAGQGGLLGLPESEYELDNLTEFNTAHNRRITMLGISADEAKRPRRIRITFKEDEDVINPEDVDPTIGRFRNMIQTTVIPRKRPAEKTETADDEWASFKLATSASSSTATPSPSKKAAFTSPNKHQGLYDDLPTGVGLFATSLSTKLGIPLPNPAPDIDVSGGPDASSASPEPLASTSEIADYGPEINDPNAPKKKKYAKEAWPGRKANPSLL